MTESADLLAAIAAAPADDLPRLVFADWLDDRGEPDYAQFIRDQIRLAQVPQWDPLAVRARHQLKDSLGIGRPFFGTLPQLPIFLKWHPEKAFRRGFGSGVVVHQLSGLLEAGPQLFDLAPVEELWLSAATLDDWRQLAKSPWLKNVRKLHFHFSQGLHEPIRCLAESKYAYNIDEIWFDTLETPAAGLVIEALAQSPLAGQLKGLHLRLMQTDSAREAIEALVMAPFDLLQSFSMTNSWFHFDLHVRLFECLFMKHICRLDFSNTQLFLYSTSNLTQTVKGLANLESFSISDLNLTYDSTRHHESNWLKRLYILSLSNLHISNDAYTMLIDNLNYASNLTCLNASQNMFTPKLLKAIFAKHSAQLNELVFSNCNVTRNVVEEIIKIDVPDKLVSIVFSKSHTRPQDHIRLESHFGDRLVWAADNAPTGLAR